MAAYECEETIAAIATPIGEGGLSVLRISGERALEIGAKVFFPRQGELAGFPSHTVHFGHIKNAQGAVVDQAVAAIFRAPHSYTGETVVELSAHGGMALTQQILNLLIQNGARHAEAGEFTKRAFLNGKIDLTQAEAVLDLIKARSTRSLELAVKQLTGGLSRKLKALKEELMNLYAHLEAYLDFPEDDLEVYASPVMKQRLEKLITEIRQLLQSFRRASLLREGVTAVLVGRPNVGKSSLFNTLLERDRALVSEVPGTTRDRLEENLEIKGVCVKLIDTAGLGMSARDRLDQMGMERTQSVLTEAQFYLFVVDGTEPLSAEDRNIFTQLDVSKPALILVNKTDLKRRMDLDELETLTSGRRSILISSKTRKGFDLLEEMIIKTVFEDQLVVEGEQITRQRHREALELSLRALEGGLRAFENKESLELIALELKTALEHLRELIGEVYSEDLLDVIFSEFCIGK